MSRYLRTHGVRSLINEQVRFARKRFGRDVGDRFSGGARGATPSAEKARWKSSTSGSNRLPSRSWPGRERERFPSRSALSRFASGIDRGTRRSPTHPVDFPISRVAHSPLPPPRSKPEAWWIEKATPGWSLTLMGRVKPRALAHYPRVKTFPRPALWLDEVCAPGYTGRKRGQVVRTRTVISQAHRWKSARQFW
jgi:hypothetical protein